MSDSAPYKRQIDFACLPSLTDLHEQGTGQSQAGSFVRKDGNHSGAAPDFQTYSLQTVDGADPASVIFREGKNGQTFGDVAFQPIGQFGSPLGVLLNRLAQLGFSQGSIWGVEDGSDICYHFSLHTLAGHILAGVLLQVKLATLPGDATEHRFAGSLNGTVRVRALELDELTNLAGN